MRRLKRLSASSKARGVALTASIMSEIPASDLDDTHGHVLCRDHMMDTSEMNRVMLAA